MSQRVYGLDILRATAIMLVIYMHCYRFFPTIPVFDGVALFFVLSGFLIGNILLKTELTGKGLFTFWIRRWLRTLPAYFFVLTFLVIVAMYGHHNSFQYLSYYTFTQNIFDGKAMLFHESWSLSVEEWFYVLIPFGFFVTYQLTGKKHVAFWAAVVIILVTALRTCLTWSTNAYAVLDWDFTLRSMVPTRLDSIMYGVLGAFFYDRLLLRKNILFIAGLFICLFTVVCLPIEHALLGEIQYSRYFILPAESIGVLFLIPKMTTIKTGSGAIFRMITLISTMSYSMYLLNYTPVQRILDIDIVQSLDTYFPPTNFIIFILISFGGAFLLNRFIERPFMNLRDRKKQDKRMAKVSAFA